MFVSSGLGSTWDTSHNQRFPTLMFDARAQSAAQALSAGSGYPGLLVGALQDNGNVYLTGDGEPWRELFDGGDGTRALFVTHDVVLRGGNDNVDLKWSRWDGTKFSDPVPLEPPGYPAGAQFLPILSRVVFPTFTDPAGGALMVAIAGDDPPTGDILGFFDKGAATSPASERFYWKKLGKVPFEVAGLGSLTGRRIIVGTAFAHVYQVDALTGSAVELSLPTGLGNAGIRWVRVASTSLAFCLAGNTLLRTTNMTTWTGVAGPPGTTLDVIDVDRWFDPVALIAAGSGGAWVSRTNGDSWQPTFDLPRHPQANHLDVVNYGGAGRLVHLGTWNWSAWRARLA